MSNTPGNTGEQPPLAPQDQPQPGGYAPPAPGQPTYAQPAYVQPVYAQPVYAQPVLVVAQPKGFSITAFVLGLVSIVFGFTFLLPLGAVIFGIVGAKKEPAGRGLAVTGIILGALCLLVWVVIVFAGGALIALLFGAAVSSSTISP